VVSLIKLPHELINKRAISNYLIKHARGLELLQNKSFFLSQFFKFKVTSTMSDQIEASTYSEKAVNPLRQLWELHQPKANPEKFTITLQIGDPTAHLSAHEVCVEALKEAASGDKFSYDVSAGTVEARQAVTDYVNQHQAVKVTPKDIVLTSGCSMALEMCFMVLANPGDNILIPRPTWNYVTWILGTGIEVQYYNLDPLNGWNVDLKHMESLINGKTRAILLNSPGNPCGNVFSKEHILDILKIAEHHKLPIIADEVYEHFVFPGVKFHPVASLSTNVPVLTCSGLTKRFLMPGIRMGWIVINDRAEKLGKVRRGLETIAGRNFGPSSVVQRALPKILGKIPQSFFDETCVTVEVSALR
jgi:tyrosine aminotransferase